MTPGDDGRVAIGLEVDVCAELDLSADVTAEYLVAEYHRDLYRYAFRLAGNTSDAEDLTQQTYLVCSRNLAQLRAPEKARSWLFSIMRNTFLKSCNKLAKVPATSAEIPIDEIPELSTNDDPVDRELLQRALDELPSEYRVVLCMFYFDDLSYKEIAEELDVPMGTVMSRLARAKSRLRHKLLSHVVDDRGVSQANQETGP